MIELSQPEGAFPLQTGERIPKERFALTLNSLIPLAEEGKVALIPRTLTDIQDRLRCEASIALPDILVKNFGLTDLTFVELFHPNTMPIVFAGFANHKDSTKRSLNKAMAFVSFGRSTGVGWSGDIGAQLNNRLLPVSIGVSGVDQQTKRIVSLRYGTEYDFPEVEDSPGIIVAFILDEVGISVSREDGFEFKEGRGTLDLLPYTYVSQYFQGIFTKEMLAKTNINRRQVFTNRIDLGRHFRFGGPRLKCPLTLGASIIDLVKHPEDFEVNHSGKLVRVGRKNIWEIQIPEFLPAIEKNPKFLQGSE